MEPKNIVFSSNKDFMSYLMVALNTLGKTNNYPINIHVIHSDLTHYNLIKIENICLKYNYHFLPLKIDKILFEGAQEMGHLKLETYYRLAIPNLIYAKSVLYLDSDILIRSNFIELFDINIDGYALAAVEDPVYKPSQNLKIKNTSKFFNAGVLLMNLDYWRQNNLSNTILDFAIENHKQLLCADQCALNAVIGADYISLNKLYNYQYHRIKIDDIYMNSLYISKIVHFTGPFKPTHYLCKHPFKILYLKELKNTPGYIFFISKHIFNNVVRIILKKLLLESLPSNIRKFKI